jgi:DNA polymerase-3 subunit delta
MSAAGKGSMSPAKFLEAVRKGKRFEMVLLRGEEEYLLREALQEFVSKTVPLESADFNYSELRAVEVSPEVLWNALTTLPFIGERRLIVLDLNGEPRKEIAEALARYMKRPAATTTLVMVFSEGGRRDWGEQQPESLVEVEFKPLSESDRTAWVGAFVKRGGKRLHPDAASYLIQTSSKSLFDLVAKLSHAILFVGDEPEISVHTLMKVSGVSSEFTVFNLEDAILERKQVEAHRIAKSLLDGGEALLRLLAFHRGTVMRLWQTKRAVHKPEAWQKSAEADKFWKELFGRQSFKLNSFKSAARRAEEVQLRNAVRHLLEVEVEAKTGTHDLNQYFEWLWRVCGQGWKPSEPAFQNLR